MEHHSSLLHSRDDNQKVIIGNDNMNTKLQLEYELEDAKQSLEVALGELNHWKESLKIIGETPEEVYESWRTRTIKMFKYIRLMAAWRGKYNLLCQAYLKRK
jgi:hypothetical protein